MTSQSHKSRKALSPPPLSAEGRAALEEQVAALKAALESGAAPEQLREIFSPPAAEPGWDLNVMGELAKITHPAIPPLLASLFGASPDKERRKALKRALHALKTRGVPVADDLLPREEPATLLTRESASALTAYVSPVFGNGEYYAVLEGSREILGRGNILITRLSDTEGFRECHLLTLSKRRRQELWEEFLSEGLGEMLPALPSYVLCLLEEALALTPGGTPEREEYLPLREDLWRHLGRPEDSPPLEDLLPPVPEGQRRHYLEESRRLAKHKLFTNWLPTYEKILPWYERLQEVQDSPLILTEAQQQMRQEMVVDEAAAALFPAAERPLWGRRLLKMAYFLHLKGQTEEAKAARAAGEDLLSEERGVLSGENPFLQEMVGYALIFAEEYQKLQQEQSPPSSLVLPPRLT